MRKSEQGLVGKGRFVAEKGTVGADKFFWTLVPTPDFRLCLWTCVILRQFHESNESLHPVP